MQMYDDAPGYDRDWDRGRYAAQEHFENLGEKPEPYGDNGEDTVVDERSEGWIDGWNHAVTHDFE